MDRLDEIIDQLGQEVSDRFPTRTVLDQVCRQVWGSIRVVESLAQWAPVRAERVPPAFLTFVDPAFR